MKKILALFILMVSLAYAQDFLVTTKDRQLLDRLKDYIQSENQQGRALVVRLKYFYKELPIELQQSLRAINSPREVTSQLVLNRSEQARTDVEQLCAQVSKNNLFQDVAHLSSYRSRKIYSSGNQETTDWLEWQFLSYGLSVERHCFREKVCNVTAFLPGNSERMVIVIGHFDSVGKAYAGADDNASGTAGVLEMARILSTYSLNHSILFIAANGEEAGLLGSTAHVQQLTNSSQLEKIAYVINMDMIGYNETNILDIETDSFAKQLAQQIAEIANTYTSLIPRVSMPAWGADHVPYLKAGVPAVLTIEDWNNHNPCYHQSCDTIDKIDFDYATEIVKLNLATILIRD